MSVPASAPDRSPPPAGRAALLMLGGVLLLTIMDAVAKRLLEGGMPLPEMMFLRSVLICGALQVWFRARGRPEALRVVDRRGQLLRGLLGSAAPLLFFAAVARLPLTAATVVGFASTFTTVILSVLWLGERVGRWRWAGIGIGYAGVLVAVGPAREGPLSGYLLALGASVAISAFYVVGKRLSTSDSPMSMVNVYNGVLGMICIAALPFVWKTPDGAELGLIVLFAALAVIGQWLVTSAFALGDASLVAPLEYTSLLWVVLLDTLLWGVSPAGHTLVGAAIIVAASLLVWYRERVAARRAAPP